MLWKRSLIWVQALSVVARNTLTRKQFLAKWGSVLKKNNVWQILGPTVLDPCALHTLLLRHCFHVLQFQVLHFHVLHFQRPVFFSRIWSFKQALLRRFAWKIWSLLSRLSSSLKGIETDTDRSATYDFLLMFHNNQMPIPRKLVPFLSQTTISV